MLFSLVYSIRFKISLTYFAKDLKIRKIKPNFWVILAFAFLSNCCKSQFWMHPSSENHPRLRSGIKLNHERDHALWSGTRHFDTLFCQSVTSQQEPLLFSSWTCVTWPKKRQLAKKAALRQKSVTSSKNRPFDKKSSVC